jgi:hypothetical protein
MHDCTKKVGRIPTDKNYKQLLVVLQLLILATGIAIVIYNMDNHDGKRMRKTLQA